MVEQVSTGGSGNKRISPYMYKKMTQSMKRSFAQLPRIKEKSAKERMKEEKNAEEILKKFIDSSV